MGRRGTQALSPQRPAPCRCSQVGGGGLIAGIAAVLRHVAPHVTVVGCQPEMNACMARSLQAGRVLGEAEYELGETASDGTAGGVEEDSITLDLCRKLVGKWVLVSERNIERGVQHVRQETGMVSGRGCERAGRHRRVQPLRS